MPFPKNLLLLLFKDTWTPARGLKILQNQVLVNMLLLCTSPKNNEIWNLHGKGGSHQDVNGC